MISPSAFASLLQSALQEGRYSLPPGYSLKLRAIPRTLVFKQPATTSRGVYRKREVWYIVLVAQCAGRSFVGLGECAPLYDLSSDYGIDYSQRLTALCREVEAGGFLEAARYRHLSSMVMGIETAFLSVWGAMRGNRLELFPSAFTRGSYGIPINGLVWMGSAPEMRLRMEQKLAAGFRCVKLKIGAIDFEKELALIQALRERYSPDEVVIRLDANGAFSPDEALQKLQRLASYHIHSIEQPIKAGQWQALASICRHSPIPIALDEELIGLSTTDERCRMLDTVRPHYVVLKPSLHGGLSGSHEWMQLARKRCIGFWVTSALESNVGLNALVQWTAYLHETEAPSSPWLTQGFGTGGLFERNYMPCPLSLEGPTMYYGNAAVRSFLSEVDAYSRQLQSPSCMQLPLTTSGSTGEPHTIHVRKEQMVHSALSTIKALQLPAHATALLCLPLNYVAARMMVVRALTAPFHLCSVPPCARPFSQLTAAPYFAAVTPQQVYDSLQHSRDRALMRRVRCLLIGGGHIPPAVEEALQRFHHPVWSSYGMTETLSHIALRRLNGPARSDAYTPLPGVTLSLSEQGTLVISAPGVCDEPVVTHDLADLLPTGRFRVTGRTDNTICSGGLKFQIEPMEQALAGLPCRFLITYLPDARLGQAVTMLYEAALGDVSLRSQLEAICREVLPHHSIPRHYLRVNALPLTASGKPARAEAARMALEAFNASRGK